MTEKKFLAALASFLPFGPARIKLLVEYFGSARGAWEAPYKKLLEIGLKDKLVKRFEDFRDSFNFKRYFNLINRLKIDVLTFDDAEYPKNLREIDDAPPVLYIRGKLTKNDENAVAIVGTRKMTSYGREVTTKLAGELASLGITIISGLAYGIDAQAHRVALGVDGRSIGVLASGVDIITPAGNTQIAKELINKNGAILSEYPLGTFPQRTFFPSRNRIISGLARGVIVVEGMMQSGTLLTASHAAEQGRTVFAVPGQITSLMSQAPHFLLKNGAKLVTSVNDILEELDMQFRVDKESVAKIMPSDRVEEKLIELLVSEPLHLDEIVRISGLATAEISARLTVMELKGLVKNMGGGIYKSV